jgi:hypothetical protein
LPLVHVRMSVTRLLTPEDVPVLALYQGLNPDWS